MIRAVVRMNAIGTRHLPVIEKDRPRLCGLLTMSDIFRVQAQAASAAEAEAALDGHTGGHLVPTK